MHLSAKILAKASACTYPKTGGVAGACPTIEYILVSKVWIQATNRFIAFRAPGPLDFMGYMKLYPKLTKSGSKKALPKSAVEVVFADGPDVTEATAPRALVVNAKGKTLGLFGDFFEIELLWERPTFPNIDRYFVPREVKNPAPRVIVDLVLMAKLAIGEPASERFDVTIEIGEGELEYVFVKNGTVKDRSEAWEAVLMPVRP